MKIKRVLAEVLFYGIVYGLLAWIVSTIAFAQTAPHVYPKLVGESATFAWDHTPLTLKCTDGTQKDFPRGVNGSMPCGDKTYAVTWMENTAKAAGWMADGTDWTGVFKYNYRAFLLSGGAASGIQIDAKGPGAYPFTVTAGRYIAYGFVALDNDSGGCDSFFTKMDDGVETIWDTPNDTAKAGQFVWSQINDRLAADVSSPGIPIVYTLSAGPHTLTLRAREGCTVINGLVILPEGSPAPGGVVVGETQTAQGETVSDRASLPFTAAGDYRLEVQTVLNTAISDWAKSTDPAYATVDGAAGGWIVRVSAAEPPPPDKPGAITGMRLLP